MIGHISDRIGFKPVFIFSFLFMAPTLWLLLQLNGYWIYFGAVLAGSFVLAPLPLGVTMAQTLAPKGRSMVASLMMGFAYGLGGGIAPIVGKLADTFTIRPVLTFMACIPLFVIPIIAQLPGTRSNG
jgi:FSR family fosmidomycin resistance protein-like MFS transporter